MTVSPTARSEAVVEAFCRLHERGLVSRGDRMVNWCPHLSTVLSDIEVCSTPQHGLSSKKMARSTSDCVASCHHEQHIVRITSH